MMMNDDWREWLREWESPASVPTQAAQSKQPPQQVTALQPRLTSRQRRIARITGLVAACVAPLIVVITLVAVLVPRSTHTTAAPIPTTPPATSKQVKAWCTPRTGNPYVSRTGGSTTSPQGVLAEMERQYFGLRSPSGVVSLTDGSWTAEDAIATTIAQYLPEEEVEWCTTVTPMEGSWWRVQVDWRNQQRTIEKSWVGDYHTTKMPDGRYLITGMRPNEEVQRKAAGG